MNSGSRLPLLIPAAVMIAVAAFVLLRDDREFDQGLLGRVEATTDDDGTFVLPRRLPPGSHEARAMRIGETDPTVRVTDLQAARRTFSVIRGQEHQELEFEIKSD